MSPAPRPTHDPGPALRRRPPPTRPTTRATHAPSRRRYLAPFLRRYQHHVDVAGERLAGELGRLSEHYREEVTWARRTLQGLREYAGRTWRSIQREAEARGSGGGGS